MKRFTFLIMMLCITISGAMQAQNMELETIEARKAECTELIKTGFHNFFPGMDQAYLPKQFRPESPIRFKEEIRSEMAVTERLYQEWPEEAGDNWSDFMKDELEYDESGYLIESMQSIYENSVWEPASKFEYTNNGAGALIEDLQSSWDGTAWNPNMKTSYLYLPTGELVEIIMQVWTGDDWMNFFKIEFILTNSRNANESFFYNWDFMMKDWAVYQWSQFTHNANLLMTLEYAQNWIDTKGWENAYQDTYTYVNDMYLSEMVEQWWENSAWLNEMRYTYSYDANWILTESLIAYWLEGAWDTEDRVLYYYGENDLIEEELFQLFDGAEWSNSQRILYSYGLVGVFEFEGKTNNFEASVTPNPFSTHVQIQFELIEAADANMWIYDQNGRLVQSIEAGKLPQGTVILTWDGKNMGGNSVAAGMYYGMIRAGDQTGIVKLIRR